MQQGEGGWSACASHSSHAQGPVPKALITMTRGGRHTAVVSAHGVGPESGSKKRRQTKPTDCRWVFFEGENRAAFCPPDAGTAQSGCPMAVRGRLLQAPAPVRATLPCKAKLQVSPRPSRAESRTRPGDRYHRSTWLPGVAVWQDVRRSCLDSDQAVRPGTLKVAPFPE